MKEAEKFYTKDSIEGPWDVLIIGSGISGLAAAAILSEEGKRVLVLEQHFQAGGYTHVFSRKKYEWDIGLHYFGKASKTSDWHLQLTGLTHGAIEFEPFGEIVDEVIFPDLKVQVPGSYQKYADILAGLFPAEKDGIHRYIKKIHNTRKGLQRYFMSNLLPRPLTSFARSTFASDMHDAATTTTEEMMSRYIKDEKLKTILDAQWGNIGMPKQRCAFFVHAAMLGNYLEEGAIYPKGGASVIAKELGRTIYKNGSAIRVSAPVDKILTEGRKVKGIKLETGEEILAPIVISTAGVRNTYDKFLAGNPYTTKIRSEVLALPLAYEYLNLFIGFDKSPREFGLGEGNSWIYQKWNNDVADLFWDVQDLAQSKHPNTMFFSSSSIRDPLKADSAYPGYNGQIVAAATQGFFNRWASSQWGRRDTEYKDIKSKISDQMIDMLNEYYPGIKENVLYTELATPLTYTSFMRSTGGVPYGLAPVPARYHSRALRPMSPIRNLFLAGQDMIMPGVPAALGSAILCSSLVLRKNAGAKAVARGKKILGIS